MIFRARGTRGLIPQKEVKVEAQVEQQSIRLGVFTTLNLDLSLDLSMGRAQWKIDLAYSSLRKTQFRHIHR